MIREYITLKTLKEATTGLAALGLGAWLGINYVVQLSVNHVVNTHPMAYPSTINALLPQWHSTALQMGRYSLVFAGVSILGWIVVDYYAGGEE